MLRFTHEDAFSISHHKIFSIIRHFGGGIFFEVAVISAIIAWSIIVWKWHRVHVRMNSTTEIGIKEQLHRNDDELRFYATIVFALLIGFIIGDALYWIIRRLLV